MAQLIRVVVQASAPSDTLDVYCAACGVERPTGEDEFDLHLGTATLTIRSADTNAGVVSVTISVEDLDSRLEALAEAGIPVVVTVSGISIEEGHAGGVAVLLIEPALQTESTANVRLDHLALRVENLAESSRCWQAITGVEPLQMGLHPVSGGAFSAARLPLGERMIELISPVPGVSSQIADRLVSHGEGSAALALPVDDLNAALQRLTGVGARVFQQAPHWMIHPNDAGGVLVQLTPRVAH